MRFDWLFEDDRPDDVAETVSIETMPSPSSSYGETSEKTLLLASATAAFARLDERLKIATEEIRAGWLARMIVEEAVGSARLEGWIVDVDRLWLLAMDAAVGAPDIHEAQALHVLSLIRSAMRRSPRQMFTARRIATLARVRDDGGRLAVAPWVDIMPNGGAPALAALQEFFTEMASLRRTRKAPMELAACMLARWHVCGAGEMMGGVVGRVLAASVLARTELCGRLLPCLSVGFLGRRWSYRPDSKEWPIYFFTAAEQGAARGISIAASLARAREDLFSAVADRRQDRHLQRAVRTLIAYPRLSVRRLAEIIGITPRAALSLLSDLESKGLVREVTRRGSFRIFRLAEPGL